MAITISCKYKDQSQLYTYIRNYRLQESPSLLIQVYSGSLDRSEAQAILKLLHTYLPQAKVVGCTSGGAMIDGEFIEKETILLFTMFNEATAEAILVDKHSIFKQTLADMVKKQQMMQSDIKAFMVLAGPLEKEAKNLLEDLKEHYDHIPLFVGQASKAGFLLCNQSIIDEGAVILSLFGKNLTVTPISQYEKKELATPFVVTKARGQTIIELNDESPANVIGRYLGKEFVKQIPHSSAALPFIVHYNQIRTRALIVKQYNNGSIKLNTTVQAGARLSISYSDSRDFFKGNSIEPDILSANNIETMFLFSPYRNGQVLGHEAEKDLQFISSHLPLNGLVSFGELSIGQEERRICSGLGITESFTTPAEVNVVQLEQKNIKQEALAHLVQVTNHKNKQLQEQLNKICQYYHILFKNNPDVVFTTDKQGTFTSINPLFELNTGYKENELLGQSVINMVSKEVVPRLRMHFNHALKGTEQIFHTEIIGKNGAKSYYEIKLVPIHIEGDIVGLYGMAKNLTELKIIENKLTELSYYDHLTGLPNKTKFTEQLNILIKRSRKNQQKLALLSIDIDRFKIINESIGHYFGDRILKQLSEKIEKKIPPESYLGNFGGDNFTLILSQSVNVDEVMKIAQSILAAIAEPIQFNQQEFYVTASVGVSLFPDDGNDRYHLLKNADIALNSSKQLGGNRITFFSDEMNQHIIQRVEMEGYLRKAIKHKQFSLHYQPLIDLESGKIFGSEALIRWNHPKLGLVTPSRFIPLAEETGLINEIGKWVLNTACSQNKQWQRLGLGDLVISVNVAAYQFQQPEFLSIVEEALLRSGLEAKYLTLELTESTMLQNIEYSIEVMNSLRKMGVKVSIDDFGTGYSSLSYLKDLPINTLKIDRSFINNLKVDTSDIAIVKAIITMGHGLRVKVLAEGVETREQIELLKQLKCHYAQGYYIQKPLNILDFEKGIRESS